MFKLLYHDVLNEESIVSKESFMSFNEAEYAKSQALKDVDSMFYNITVIGVKDDKRFN